ncbi:hypothetical protein CRYUN_Cryun05aG0257400 [Craigia yunnanensis]
MKIPSSSNMPDCERLGCKITALDFLPDFICNKSETLASVSLSSRYAVSSPLRSIVLSWTKNQKNQKSSLTVAAAVGDVSADSTTYLIAGAAIVALVGTGFPIVFSRKDL